MLKKRVAIRIVTTYPKQVRSDSKRREETHSSVATINLWTPILQSWLHAGEVWPTRCCARVLSNTGWANNTAFNTPKSIKHKPRSTCSLKYRMLLQTDKCLTNRAAATLAISSEGLAQTAPFPSLQLCHHRPARGTTHAQRLFFLPL